MYRFIEKKLLEWKNEKHPHPIMLRGARQIGKTYCIENFAKNNFENYITLNFDKEADLDSLFLDLDPTKILERIQLKTGQRILVGKTLIFLDEIQESFQAIKSLRYFYEKIPGLHVISAGSLLDFALSSGKFSMPVGRVHFLFLGPMSFYEYLYQRDKGDDLLIAKLKSFSLTNPIDDQTHEVLLNEVKKYSGLGGMPEIINEYFQNPDDVNKFEKYTSIQNSILLHYREDFHKYASKARYPHLERVFASVPKMTGKKFKYSQVDKTEFKMNTDESRELREATELLAKANVINLVHRTSAAGLPFEAEASSKSFKAIFLDIGLMNKSFGNSPEILGEILSAKDFHSIAAGALAEQFVGQELLANLPFIEERKLYYWARDAKNSSAEIDYLINIGTQIFPIEVKAGKTGRLTSLHMIVQEYKMPFGIRISSKKLDFQNQVLSIPFYAIPEIPRLVKMLK